MVDTVCSRRETIRIAGDDYPAEVVKSRFLKLNSSHIEYVLDRMRENTTYLSPLHKRICFFRGKKNQPNINLRKRKEPLC